MKNEKGAMTELMEENKRLKARCKMLRKLRHTVVIVAQEPNGRVSACYTLPHHVYEQKLPQLSKLKEWASEVLNLDVKVIEPTACDTLVEFESEIRALEVGE